MSNEVNNVTDAKPEVEPLRVIPANSSVSNSGIEDTLTNSSLVFLIVAVLLGLFFMWESGMVNNRSSLDSWGEHGYSWSFVIVGIFSIMAGIILRLILEGMAVIISLLRKISSR
jgi:uncharacterized membrane protein HdeD (DUF308 family)